MVTTENVWADANINASQQQIIKKYLFCFGKQVFLAGKAITVDYLFYSVPELYGEYKYKVGHKAQKPEKCMLLVS
jgi:hypothetical protein